MYDYRKITAIIQVERLEAVEKSLQAIAVPGISVTKVKGYGEYANFFSSDWTCEHARIEIFVHETQTEKIVSTIMDSAHTGISGDGIVVVLPVESIFRIKTKKSIESE